MGSGRRTTKVIGGPVAARQAAGVVRHVDSLGRIVIPVEIRRRLGIAVSDPLEIGVRGDSVVLSKPHDVCVFCGAATHLTVYRDRNVCGNCRIALAVDVVSA
jgi:AbrB family transcriptional regulator, transcriptional pleiotropic regulator of transition state genes